MGRRQVLVVVASSQLVTQLAGLGIALHHARYYDVGFLRGSAESIARDAVFSGTAYSAPVSMLLVQLWAVRRLADRPDDLARRVLGLLGALNVPGYLSERFTRQHLRPRGWDVVETPVLGVGIGLAAGMAVLGHQQRSGR
jgi:hypothetical protein